MVFLKSLMDQANTLADGLYLRITQGRVIEDGSVYFACRVFSVLFLSLVWVILSHVTVWLTNLIF